MSVAGSVEDYCGCSHNNGRHCRGCTIPSAPVLPAAVPPAPPAPTPLAPTPAALVPPALEPPAPPPPGRSRDRLDVGARDRDVKGVWIPLRGKQQGAEMRNSGCKETKLELPVLKDLQGKDRSTPKARRMSTATHQVSGAVKAVGRGEASDSLRDDSGGCGRTGGGGVCERRTRTRKETGQREQERTVGDHEPSVQVLGHAGRPVAVAAAPPPLASAATVPAPIAASVAPPLPSPAAAVTPLPSPAVSVTPPAATGWTSTLPSPGVTGTPPQISPPAAIETDPAAAAAPKCQCLQLQHPQNQHPPHRHPWGLQYLPQEQPQAPQQPPTEKNEEGTAGRTGSQGVT
ncbi:unnamed protein product [Closterium sp. NIES-53]